LTQKHIVAVTDDMASSATSASAGAPAAVPLPVKLSESETKQKTKGGNYKGFVAGVFSGMAKLAGTISLSLFPVLPRVRVFTRLT
jgi:hypothetical protein